MLMRVRVIDTIDLSPSWTHRYPELEARGEGVMAVLDPEQIKSAPEIEGRTIVITRPDGSVRQLVATTVEVHHSVVGIFFKGASSDDVPRGAELEW